MQYWLFKTEPHEFSLQMLHDSPNQSARWDGIRNYQARNYLKNHVAPGDEVFIYHSSTTPCAIVGTARITTAAYPDPAQFNPQSPYFDAKATPSQPRWYAVDICWQSTFKTPIPLAWIKQQPPLHAMALLKQSRLSIVPVTKEEWVWILGGGIG